MQHLLEKTRQELIDKSRGADIVKSYGTTRYDRRDKQQIATSIKDFNKIDMNALFQGNMLSFIIPVKGETNNYQVEVLFEGICDDIRKEIQRNKNVLEYKCVYRALIDVLNKQDILISCTCPDWTYRQAYHATKGRYNSGRPEVRASDITNPDDTKGAGCKHVMKVIGNLDWALKLATVINNYIEYMKQNYEDKYARLIHPVLFDTPYTPQQEEQEEPLELDNTMDNEDTSNIDSSNEMSPEEIEEPDGQSDMEVTDES